MGIAKRYIEEVQEERHNRVLAEFLGISYEELCECEWDYDTNESKDGLIYSHLVCFRDSSPIQVLNKIKEIGDNLIVEIDPGTFDTLFEYN